MVYACLQLHTSNHILSSFVKWVEGNKVYHGLDKAIPPCQKKNIFSPSVFVCGCTACICAHTAASLWLTTFNLSGNPQKTSLLLLLFGNIVCTTHCRCPPPTTNKIKPFTEIILQQNMKHCDAVLIEVWVPVGYAIFFHCNRWALHLFIPKQTAAAAAGSIKDITFCVPRGVFQERTGNEKRYRLNHDCVFINGNWRQQSLHLFI